MSLNPNEGQEPAAEYEFTGDITDYWTYTQVRDYLLMMPGLTDPAMRMYLLVRSMVSETKKHLPGQGLRRMTIDQLCFLLTRDLGKPVSVSLVYQVLTILEDLDLVIPRDTRQDAGASQLKGKEKAVRGILRGFTVRDLPPVPYTGWRNAWHKLDHYQPDWRDNPPLPPMHVTTAVVDNKGRQLSKVTQVPQDVAFQDSGTGPEGPSRGSGQGADPDQDSFQDPGKPFQDPGTAVQHAGTDSPLTSEDEGSPTTFTKNSAEEDDAPSGRSPVDGRSPSSTGSRSASEEGDSVASSKDSPADLPQNDYADGSPGAKSSSKGQARHTRAQLDLVREVRAFFPPELAVPELPAVSQAILDALAGDVPAADRTPAQLGARIQERWDHHGYASRFYAGELENPVGAAIAMVRPLKGSDRYGCANPRCEAGRDLDTDAECTVCPERIAARKAERRQQKAQEAPGGFVPAGADDEPSLPAQRAQNRRCDGCRTVFGPGADPAVSTCRTCREEREETERIRAQLAAQFGTPEQREAYAANAPF